MRRRLGKFEMYVQFDGPQVEGQFDLRGADLREIRRRAIDEAGALGVPSTLAMTITPMTLQYLGDTLRFGLERRHCRGITFQPMFTSGRVPQVSSSTLPVATPRIEPISVGDVILQLVEQSRGLMCVEDFTPRTCGDPNCHTISYLLRLPQETCGIEPAPGYFSLQGFLKDRVDYRVEDLMRCGCETEPLGELIKHFEISPDSPFAHLHQAVHGMRGRTTRTASIAAATHVIKPDGTLDSFCHYYLSGGARQLTIGD